MLGSTEQGDRCSATYVLGLLPAGVFPGPGGMVRLGDGPGSTAVYGVWSGAMAGDLGGPMDIIPGPLQSPHIMIQFQGGYGTGH